MGKSNTNTNTYVNRVAEFEQQQKQHAPCATNVIISPPSGNSKNPYRIARETVLNNFPEWRRNEVLGMERSGNLDNSHYMQFVKEVAEEGDRLS